MCIISQHFQISHAIVRCSCAEDIASTESGEDGEASRRTAGDSDAPLVDLASRDEVLNAGDGVLNVDDPPVLLQSLAVLATVA